MNILRQAGREDQQPKKAIWYLNVDINEYISQLSFVN